MGSTIFEQYHALLNLSWKLSQSKSNSPKHQQELSEELKKIEESLLKLEFKISVSS